jgi:hypothetical protein
MAIAGARTQDTGQQQVGCCVIPGKRVSFNFLDTGTGAQRFRYFGSPLNQDDP